MPQNPFQFIYKACHKGTMASKLENPLQFPRCVDVELTNCCNFKCKMCPIGQNTIKREQGFMDGSVFHKVLRELRMHMTPIRFIRWGEPTLHPMWLSWIQDSKDAGLMSHLNTNGSLIDETALDRIVAIPLNSIKFSFQGTSKEDYQRIRYGGNWDKLMETIKLLHLKRANRNWPYIQAGVTVEKESPEQIQSFKEVVSPYVDDVYVNKTKDLTEVNPPEMIIECPEVFDKLSVNWDGTVSACCGDYDNKMLVGDVKTNTLKEIWESSKLNVYREMLAARKHSELDLCCRCARIWHE